MLTQQRKSVVLGVRVTPIEREAIINRARRAGKSVSDYMRGAAMHYAEQPTSKPVASRFLASSDGKGGA